MRLLPLTKVDSPYSIRRIFTAAARRNARAGGAPNWKNRMRRSCEKDHGLPRPIPGRGQDNAHTAESAVGDYTTGRADPRKGAVRLPRGSAWRIRGKRTKRRRRRDRARIRLVAGVRRKLVRAQPGHGAVAVRRAAGLDRQPAATDQRNSCPVGVMSPSSSALRRRNSNGSRPNSRA